jgi:hypothetical protein
MKNALIAALLMGTAAVPFTASAQDAPAAGGAATANAPTASDPGAATSTPSTSANLAVGTKVLDPQGGEVGTVASIAGDNVVLDTGTTKATLARSSFGTTPAGPTIGMTKAQLEAAVNQAKAQASTATDTALAPGAEVRSKDGQSVGKIASVNGDNVVVSRPEGPVTLKKANFTADQQGPLLGMTAAEFDSAAKAATASSKGGKTAG